MTPRGWRVEGMMPGDRPKHHAARRIAKGDIEMRKDILTPQQIKSDTQARREHNRGRESRRAQLQWQTVGVDPYGSAVSDGNQNGFPLPVIHSKTGGFLDRENREEGARIHIRFDVNPPQRPLQAHTDDW